MAGDDAIGNSASRAECGKDDLDRVGYILHVQERIIMTDGYGPPALILFWIGLAAFYVPKLRRACRPGLRRFSHSIAHRSIVALYGRRR
ncbi:MAG: hypothetical protein QCH35_03440 [Methanomicrobiaceae archaeon]|nr:hypothetical protein [Methanomicrobiaceae archaeon]